MKLSEFNLKWYRQWETSHSFLEEWSRPGLTNFLGSVQTGNDVTSLRHPIFPPVSGSEESTAYLTVNGTFLPATLLKTAVNWTPWSIQRQVEAEGLTIRSEVAMPWCHSAVVMKIGFLANVSGEYKIALRMSGRCVNRGIERWFWGLPSVGLTVSDLHDQSGMNPIVEPLGDCGKIWQERPGTTPSDFVAPAFSGQALSPSPHAWEENGDASWTFRLEKGEQAEINFVLVMSENRSAVEAAAELAGRVPALIAEAEANWRKLWKQVFEKSSLFSGCLSDLELPEELMPVAASALLDVLMLRRQHARNSYRTRYSISMPRRVEACFYVNDWALAADILAELDPETTWEQLEIALAADIRKYNQINTLTGKGGSYDGHPWPYTIDIFNSFYTAQKLVDVLGLDALNRTINTVDGSRTLLEVMENLAFDWRTRKVDALGLADYGPRQLLLECVSTYEHVVASINAGAIWMLRSLAEIYERLGRSEEAGDLTREADGMLQALLQHLYVDGKGWFRTVAPDGTARECRHCWDTGMVLWLIGDLLPKSVQDEMVAFFQRELQTPGWLRALSPHDADAAISGVRADHQYNGAFGAWPAEIALGLLKIGRKELVTEWLKGIARTARQGPFGQAHADEGVVYPAHGGAAKVTDELPQCCHWCNLSGGLFFAVMRQWADSQNKTRG